MTYDGYMRYYPSKVKFFILKIKVGLDDESDVLVVVGALQSKNDFWCDFDALEVGDLLFKTFWSDY
jgi:hypothetical protein